MKYYSLFLLVLLAACQDRQVSVEEFYGEPYRPQFHFSPKSAWMNDPNGMFQLDGSYHLFYQYYPDSTVWGPMHWGHAVSRDLLHWEERPIALYPDSLGYIFSGSAVVDHENRSGLGSLENPPVVALYTYHDPLKAEAGDIDFQYQGLAYSTDGGESWTKYKGNPVLRNPGIRDFRDPKVRWFEPTGKWIMTLAVADHIRFYSSANLIDWAFESEFGIDQGSHAGVWECPDLIPMRVEGTGQTRWVLLVSINPGGPQGGSATQYFVGDFDGTDFILDPDFASEIQGPGESAIWLDYGADNYAGVTWSNVPDDRPIFMGWMSNWQYAQQVPTHPWRSAMTLPRELSLHTEKNSYRIHSRPVVETEDLKGVPSDPRGMLPGPQCHISAELRGDFSLTLINEQQEALTLSLEEGIISLDRSRAGRSAFEPGFAAVHTLEAANWSPQTLSIYLDASSVEIFFNNGQRVLTELIFPTEPYTEIRHQGAIYGLQVAQMKSIWHPR